MNRIVKYVKNHAVGYTVAILAMFFGIALDMFNPLLTKVIVDDVIQGGNMEVFQQALLGLIGITLGRAVLGYTKEYIFDVTSTKVIMKLRKDLFDHIQSLSFSFFDGMNTGELMSRIKEDADNIWRALGFGIMLFVEQVIYFIVASTLLFALNWKLAIISLTTMPIIAFFALKLEKKMDETFGKISDQAAVLNTTAQENIAGVRLVKAFAREKYEISKFLKENQTNYELNVEQAKVWSKYHPRIEFLSNIVTVLVTAIGGYLVIGEEMSIGTLVAFSGYVFMLIWPMRMLGWLTNLLAQCNASVKKIDRIFNHQPEIQNNGQGVVPQSLKGHITLDNVCFEYHGVPVLKNINIDIKPGNTAAIMGLTGSGKSSIINLLARYYDAGKGKIIMDGMNIQDMDLAVLRRNISVVMQDTFLFSDTIKENIKFGDQQVSDEELMAAARDALVHEFVMHMPNGYDTLIGERGIGLSGGQKQRISIARALVKDSKVLILDDATSALDMETEFEIQKAVENRKDVTKLIIAHRISAVKNADEILIIENGEIVERGTHQELLDRKGRYYNTYQEQYEGFLGMKEAEIV